MQYVAVDCICRHLGVTVSDMTENDEVRAIAPRGNGTRVTLAVRVTKATHEILTVQAQRQQVTVSELVRALLRRGRSCEAAACEHAERVKARGEELADLLAERDALLARLTAAARSVPDAGWASSVSDGPAEAVTGFTHSPDGSFFDADGIRRARGYVFDPSVQPPPKDFGDVLGGA